MGFIKQVETFAWQKGKKSRHSFVCARVRFLTLNKRRAHTCSPSTHIPSLLVRQRPIKPKCTCNHFWHCDNPSICQKKIIKIKTNLLDEGLSLSAFMPQPGPRVLQATNCVRCALLGRCQQSTDWVTDADGVRLGSAAPRPAPARGRTNQISRGVPLFAAVVHATRSSPTSATIKLHHVHYRYLYL